MTFEVEQKFAVDSLSGISDKLVELGATIRPAELQVDLYFAHPSRDFATTDEALRIRRVGQGSFITYKGPKIDAVTKTRREIEFGLAPGGAAADRAARLLESLGFRPVAEVRKHRRAASIRWQGKDIEVLLDEVDGLGPFVELELQADQAGLGEAKAKIASLAAHLGLSRNQRLSYLELLLAGKGTAPPS